MLDMFYYCEKLTSLDLSNFRTPLVKTMEQMFKGCKALTELDLSTFDYSSLGGAINGNVFPPLAETFAECTNLTTLNLGNSVVPNDVLTNDLHISKIFNETSSINTIICNETNFTAIWTHGNEYGTLTNDTCLKMHWVHYTQTGTENPYVFTSGGTLGAAPEDPNLLGLTQDELVDLENDIATISEAEYVEETEDESLELSEESSGLVKRAQSLAKRT